MAEFHRMVTYLYLYEGNVKTRNVGYTKIEKRDAQCRVEIHMKSTGLNDDTIPVYFYTQSRTGFSGIRLGSMHFVRGTGEFKEVLNTASLSDIKGIFLPVSESKMILSQWDDDVFDRSAFFPDDAPVSAEPSAEPPAEPPAVPEVIHSESFDSEPSALKAAEAAPVLVPDEPEAPEAPQSFSSRWEFIMNNFPCVSPFPAEDSFQWVQLELKDLRLLPAPYKALGNNSFLVHGFFNYHHLLLGKKGDAASPEWVLGIPGVFQNPEGVMAAIFGFPEFISTSESDIKTGHFGYWLRPLE